MKKDIKRIAYSILNITRAIFLSNKGASILLYHDVGDSDIYLTVSPGDFRRQMTYLKDNSYNVLSLSEFVSRLMSNSEIPRKTVVLTFDDGYLSHLKNVLPILEEKGFSGTFFIAAGFTGKNINNSENKPQPTLDLESIKKLDQSYFADVQPHSVSHRELTSLGKREIKEEVRMSKKFFDDLLGKNCEFFAYPRGKYSKETIEELKKEGFKGAVTVESQFANPGANLFLLPRHTINSATSLAEFKAKIPS